MNNWYKGQYVAGYGNSRKVHILISEKALGRALPVGAVVHHANEDKKDNSPSNLVICPDAAYHQLLHMRLKAIKNSGHADWLKCQYCQQYDAPENLSVKKVASRKTALVYHKACCSAASRAFREKRMAA